MQPDRMACAQPENDGLETTIGSVRETDLRVILDFNDAPDLLRVTHQLPWQCKLCILARSNSHYDRILTFARGVSHPRTL